MGITGLWDVLGEGEVWHIADYAADFFQRHHRPLRIAVDTACWRFRNLNAHQVETIREGEAAANPIEKVILQRIYRLLRLNIQLIFVDDGMRRPWKRGKSGGGKLDDKLKALTRKMLNQLKVPHHLAPGEAEAECARMQAMGIVDVVWTDDGDYFMFGGRTLMKQHKSGNTNVKDHVRIYRVDDILQKHDLDRESLVLFALLAGGDYDTKGLAGCGPSTAARVAKRQTGLARALCHASKQDMAKWREDLQRELRGKTDVPWTFPDFKALGHYRSPTISTDEQLRNLRGLRNGSDKQIDQRDLREFLRHMFNFTTREFLKHIAPILVARELARATTLEQKAENVKLGLQLKRTRKIKAKEGEDEPPAKTEVKLLFAPISVVEFDLGACPDEEDWSKFAAKDGTPYDPTQAVECELLDCFLKHGLPEGALVEAPPPARKRKRDTDVQENAQEGEGTPTSSSKKEKPARGDQDSTPKKRGRPPKDAASGEGKKTWRSRKKVKEPARSPTPPRPTFRMPEGLAELRAKTQIVDLCEDEESSGSEADDPEEDLDLARAIQLSLIDNQSQRGSTQGSQSRSQESSSKILMPTQSTNEYRSLQVKLDSPPMARHGLDASLDSLFVAAPPQHSLTVPPSTQNFVPGKTISAQALRDPRAGSSLLGQYAASPSTASSLKSKIVESGSAPAGNVPEVIDLT